MLPWKVAWSTSLGLSGSTLYLKYVMVRSSLQFLFCLCPFYFLWILSKTAIVMYVFQIITLHTSPVIKGLVIYQEKNSPCMQLHVWTLINKGRSLEALPQKKKHQKLQILKILATNYRSTPFRLEDRNI